MTIYSFITKSINPFKNQYNNISQNKFFKNYQIVFFIIIDILRNFMKTEL